MRPLIHDDERGQTLPLVALFLLVLMSMLALALDAGYAYAQRRFMQNAADAGALAAVTLMTNGEQSDSAVRSTATWYAQQNRASSVTMTYLDAGKNPLANPANGIVPANASYIRVTASGTFPTFFARVMGINTLTASAKATAYGFATSVASMGNLVPESLPIDFYNSCLTTQCDLWNSQYAKSWGTPSNMKGLLDLSDGTAGCKKTDCVPTWTQYGYPGQVTVGSYLPYFNGDLGSHVAEPLRARFGCDAGSSGGTVDIVIWDRFDSATGTFRVARFGRFMIYCSDIHGSQAWGHFVDWVVPGYYHFDGDPPAGPKVILLTE